MSNKNDPYLKLIPTILNTIKYEIIENDRVCIIIENNSKIQKFFRKIKFNIPYETKIVMDEYSSFVFLQIDGQKSIYKIGQIAKHKFPDNSEFLYERLVTFSDYCKEKKWITYI